MRKLLLVVLSVLSLVLVLSACMNVNGVSAVSIRSAISAAASGSTAPATIEGVVTYGFGDYVLIQDQTAAIEVYAQKSNFSSVYKKNDKLRVCGVVKNYKGNWEILPSSISNVVKIGTGSVTPVSFPKNTAVDQNYDWMLVKVQNLPVKQVADKYGDVILSNGTQGVTIFSFDSDVKKWLSNLATGDKVSVQGIVEDHYGWKILLRDKNDELQ